MIYFEYIKEEGHPEYGAVQYMHFQPDLLIDYNTAQGVFIESVPSEPVYNEDYEYVLHYNPEAKEMVYKQKGRLANSEDVQTLMKYQVIELVRKEITNPNLFSANNYYESLNKESSKIEDLRVAKYNAIKETCDVNILHGFYSTSTDAQYGFSEVDQMNMTQQMILFFINPSPVVWKTKDKGLIELTKEKFVGVAFEAQAHKEKQINHWWQLKANILAAQTKEEIIAIEWVGTIL